MQNGQVNPTYASIYIGDLNEYQLFTDHIEVSGASDDDYVSSVTYYKFCFTFIASGSTQYYSMRTLASSTGGYRGLVMSKIGREPYTDNLQSYQDTIGGAVSECVYPSLDLPFSGLSAFTGSNNGFYLRVGSDMDGRYCSGNPIAQHTLNIIIGRTSSTPTPTPTVTPTPSPSPTATPNSDELCYQPWNPQPIEDTPWGDIIPVGEEQCTVIIPGGDVGEYFTIPGVEVCVTYIQIPSMQDFFPYMPYVSAATILGIVAAIWLLKQIMKQWGG